MNQDFNYLRDNLMHKRNENLPKICQIVHIRRKANGLYLSFGKKICKMKENF